MWNSIRVWAKQVLDAEVVVSSRSETEEIDCSMERQDEDIQLRRRKRHNNMDRMLKMVSADRNLLLGVGETVSRMMIGMQRSDLL